MFFFTLISLYLKCACSCLFSLCMYTRVSSFSLSPSHFTFSFHLPPLSVYVFVSIFESGSFLSLCVFNFYFLIVLPPFCVLISIHAPVSFFSLFFFTLSFYFASFMCLFAYLSLFIWLFLYTFYLLFSIFHFFVFLKYFFWCAPFGYLYYFSFNVIASNAYIHPVYGVRLRTHVLLVVSPWVLRPNH
jgi:hypothetical protein